MLRCYHVKGPVFYGELVYIVAGQHLHGNQGMSPKMEKFKRGSLPWRHNHPERVVFVENNTQEGVGEKKQKKHIYIHIHIYTYTYIYIYIHIGVYIYT